MTVRQKKRKWDWPTLRRCNPCLRKGLSTVAFAELITFFPREEWSEWLGNASKLDIYSWNLREVSYWAINLGSNYNNELETEVFLNLLPELDFRQHCIKKRSHTDDGMSHSPSVVGVRVQDTSPVSVFFPLVFPGLPPEVWILDLSLLILNTVA